MESGKEGTKPSLTRVENIPIFYLALLPNTIEKGIKEFKALPAEQSGFERSLFYYFVKEQL